jgi:hypothetical protein
MLRHLKPTRDPVREINFCPASKNCPVVRDAHQSLVNHVREDLTSLIKPNIDDTFKTFIGTPPHSE